MSTHFDEEKFLSTALVDYSGLGKTVNYLFTGIRGLSIVTFLDFCTILEAVILYDKLIVVGDPKKENSNFFGPLQELVKNGILTHESQRSRIAKIPRPFSREQRANHFYSFHRPNKDELINIEDAWFETGRIIGAEREYGCSALALLRQKPIYEKYAYVPEEHSVCDLIGHYESLKEALLNIRRSTSYSKYIIVPIPPISLMVLQNSQNSYEIFQIALDLRDKYKNLRNSLKQLREDLADDSIAPKKKLKLIESWERSWKTLEKYQQWSFFEIANTTNQIVNIDKALDNFDINSLRIDKIIQLLLSYGENIYRSWRIRVLHNTARNYLSTPNIEINKEIRRLFHYEISEKDIEQLKSLRLKI